MIAPKALSRSYDPAFRPWWQKPGMTLGMGMTEKQGGTDVRANTTEATPHGDGYTLAGHKWFLSAPMSDAFLVLAQAPGGLTCFLLPRFLPDGSLNALRLQRLKDKLGNRSNASSEVECADAFAWRVGDEGAGVRTILQMVQLTRFDCAIASAGLMRMALAQAVHHCRHRTVFGKPLIEQPMMRAVLADMALELEGAMALVMRLGRAFDRAAAEPGEAAYARLLTPATKYSICKTAPSFIYEAMECLGGNGYVEESIMPRLYREAPVNAIWEGSGNVMCLDVLRALLKEPETGPALFAELEESSGADPRLDAQVAKLRGELSETTGIEARARRVVETMALALQGSLVVRHAPPEVAEAFCASRLAGDAGHVFGTLPAHVDFRAIVERHRPVL
jgi:putative acyl-CoA dehydrogenase